jgi:hypothetical protein
MNKTATQNIIFQNLGGGGLYGTNWPTEIVKIAHYEFDENYRFFTASCDPYMGHILRPFFTHFTIKRTQRLVFKKNA